MTHQHKIPDEVVIAASDSYMDGAIAQGYVYAEGTMADHRELIKAALQTALSMLLGEPVAYVEPVTFNSCDSKTFQEVTAQWPDTYKKWFPVYALKEKQS